MLEMHNEGRHEAKFSSEYLNQDGAGFFCYKHANILFEIKYDTFTRICLT